MNINTNSWNQVINGNETYKRIARELLDTGKCIIGWTDGEYDHRDILFTYRPKILGGTLQRGLRWYYLYVSIMDVSCMGFLIENDRDNRKSTGYIQEKLRLDDNSCDIKICELVNGVIHEIDNVENEENDE